MAVSTSDKSPRASKKIAAPGTATKGIVTGKVAATKRKSSKTVAKKTAPTSVTKKTAAGSTAAKAVKPRTAAAKPPKSPSRKPAKPAMLSGGNPQIPKGYGNAPVKAYIAAIPGWKRAVARRLDALVVRTVPGVHKAVKWNTPLYGIEGEGWFLAMHCFTHYVKVTFFRGTSLEPVPPVASKTPETRYFHIHEDDAVDEAQLADWIKQASALPGERM